MADPQPTSITSVLDSALIARGLFDLSPFSAVLYDPRGRVLAVNAAFERMWGVSRDTVPPDYSVLEDEQLERQGALPAIRRAFAGEAVVTPPLRYDIAAVSTTGVGRTLWTEGHFWPLRDDAGAVVNVMLMHIELTARIEAMQQLTEARDAAERERARLRLVAEAGAILASSLDPHATVQRVAEIVVPDFADWCVVDVVDENGGLVPLAVAHGDPHRIARTIELRRLYPSPPDAPTGPAAVLRSQRSELYVEISDDILARASRSPEHLQLLRDVGLCSVILVPLSARGRPLGVLQMCMGAESGRRFSEADLTTAEEIGWRAGLALDNAQLFEAERSARAEAEGANRAKMEFLATMSHELRTPLNAIGGYADLLEMELHGPINAAQRQDLERMRRSQRALVTLVEDVLNFAKIEAGSVSFRAEAVPLSVALLGLEAMVAPQFSARGLSYVVRVPSPEITVRADREKLEQIMLNLLSNAVKFTESGTVDVSAEARDGNAYVAVRDTGIGVPSDKLELIFDPFYQVQSGYTRRASGTGLGLAISRDLARRMGGDVTVTSAPGSGSTFVLRLPLESSGQGQLR